MDHVGLALQPKAQSSRSPTRGGPDSTSCASKWSPGISICGHDQLRVASGEVLGEGQVIFGGSHQPCNGQPVRFSQQENASWSDFVTTSHDIYIQVLGTWVVNLLSCAFGADSAEKPALMGLNLSIRRTPCALSFLVRQRPLESTSSFSCKKTPLSGSQLPSYCPSDFGKGTIPS